MVKAILEDKKIQTRRVIKNCDPAAETIELRTWDNNNGYCDGYGNIFNSPYSVGDTLWVRETWTTEYDGIHDDNGYGRYVYKVDGKTLDIYEGSSNRWRPSIHMPRAAARLFLKVTDIRCERLQNITENETKAEGIKGIPRSRELYPTDDYIYPFKTLWDSIYAPKGYGYGNEHTYGWLENPWVWVIEFERMV
jgi:hypothetical protein